MLSNNHQLIDLNESEKWKIDWLLRMQKYKSWTNFATENESVFFCCCCLFEFNSMFTLVLMASNLRYCKCSRYLILISSCSSCLSKWTENGIIDWFDLSAFRTEVVMGAHKRNNSCIWTAFKWIDLWSGTQNVHEKNSIECIHIDQWKNSRMKK